MTYEEKLDALADPMRRALIDRLRKQPRTVGELAAELPISRPAVSQHLAVLKAAGLVEDEARGTARLYRLRPQGVAELKRWLDGLWNDALDALKSEADVVPGPSADRAAAPPPRRGGTRKER